MPSSSSKKHLISRFVFVILALAVLGFCSYLLTSNMFQTLPHLWRLGILAVGWVLALILFVKSLPSRNSATSPTVEQAEFPSKTLSYLLQSQQGLEQGFVALDSRARVVLTNDCAKQILDLRETEKGEGLARAFHPDVIHQFKNTFAEVHQNASGSASLKLRGFNKLQQLREFRVSMNRWKESPAQVVATISDISELEQSRQELQMARDALHDLHGVFGGESGSMLDAMRAVLELGCMHFHLDIGLIAKTAGKNNQRLEVLQVLAPHEELARGDVFDVNSAIPTVLGNAAFISEHKKSDIPAVYKVTHGETFLGAPIHCQDKLYGMICFASPVSRSRGFWATELELIQLVAQWIGEEIEHRQQVEQYQTRQEHLTELNQSLEVLLRADLVTGLANAAAFDDALQQEFDRAKEFDLPLSLLAISPQGIEEYHEKYGDQDWQSALETLAKALEQNTRSFDPIARYRDNIFVILLSRTTASQATQRGETLKNIIVQTPCKHHRFTANIGLASLSAECHDSTQLLQQALDGCEMAAFHPPLAK